MIIEIDDDDLKTFILTGRGTKGIYRKLMSNSTLKRDLSTVLGILRAVQNTERLKEHGRLYYERLKYGLKGYSSVRINKNEKSRLLFTEHDGGTKIRLLYIDYHYGNK